MKLLPSKTTSALLSLCLGLFLLPFRGHAEELLFESAALGDPPDSGPGIPILRTQWPSCRFHVSQAVEITSVGARMRAVVKRGFFIAVVRLSGPDAVPVGGPGNSETEAGGIRSYKPFNPEELIALIHPSVNAPETQDVSFPLNVTLDPGDYGLVFGFGLHGMVDEPQTLGIAGGVPAPDISYFWYGGGIWRTDGIGGLRFFLHGNLAP